MKNWRSQIEVNPDVIYGEPFIKETMNPADFILWKMLTGEKNHVIKVDYPTLLY